MQNVDDIEEIIRLSWLEWNNGQDTWRAAKPILGPDDHIPGCFMKIISSQKIIMSPKCNQQWLIIKISNQTWNDIFNILKS